MFYFYTLEVPPLTSKANPVTKRMPLSFGVIRDIYIGFPKGCAALVHVVIFHENWQLIPLNREEDLAYDNYVFETMPFYELYYEPFELLAKGWSDAKSYPHRIVFGINLLLPEELGLPFPRLTPEELRIPLYHRMIEY